MLYNFFKSYKIKKYPELKTVENLDLEKYLGRWFELARFPVIFEKGLVACEANYSLNQDGTIRVQNTGRKGTVDGKLQVAAGKAKPAGCNSKLNVWFYVPIAAPYWVIDIDEDYQWALVGDPARDFLWILCRTPTMDEELFQKIVAKGEAEGFDMTKLQRTPQKLDGDAQKIVEATK